MRRWNLYQLLHRPHPSKQVVALVPSKCAMVTFLLCSNIVTQESFRGGGAVVEGAREGYRGKHTMASAITNCIVLMILLGGILVGIVVGVVTEMGVGVGTETRVGTTVEVVVVVATMKAVRVYRKTAGILIICTNKQAYMIQW